MVDSIRITATRLYIRYSDNPGMGTDHNRHDYRCVVVYGDYIKPCLGLGMMILILICLVVIACSLSSTFTTILLALIKFGLALGVIGVVLLVCAVIINQVFN